ncbi:MAG: plasma-membrane proton-efflux P-type ATPase [Kiritimatiellaeota bacterium]|nr:plasma-membrane proton-efflux P-type ATPase [Kiritimatiellota bacterium]
MEIDELLATLKADRNGLSQVEIEKRLEECGRNAIVAKTEPAWLKLLKFFWGPIPWMIEIAAVLSLLAKDIDDFLIISFMLVFNAVIGFWEEHKASNALDALKKGLALKARALRDGNWSEIDASELVPGDVVRLRLGDVVPADCKLVDGEYISIDQAALTGESLPVNKKIGDAAYSGSIAKQGEMIAIVTATGGDTFFGRTANLVAQAGNESHFQQAVMRIGNFLIAVSVFLCLVLSVVVLYRDHMHGTIDIAELLRLVKLVLILAIASIPVAMPAVLSVTMALGALAMSKKKAIVSKLQAIEEMAGVDILCSDKTGTLTKNELSLQSPVLFAAKDEEECVLAGALASKEENNDAIDLAIIGALKDRSRLDAYNQTEFVPFDPVSKRTEATAKDADGKEARYTKGAPQVVIDMCVMDDSTESKAVETVAEFAKRGYRTLGVARSDDDGKSWTFLGIIPMFDPPRDDSAETIRQAKEHGLRVKMVTGDDIAIAAETSGQLGMGTRIQAATDIFADYPPDHLPDREKELIDKADGFGRVFPEHKYGIVKALQERGHIVAMTGDGVNDAPALKQADAGIAVSGATDAARSAAALILTAPGLSVIINAIEIARQIFARMTSYTIYRIAMTIDIMVFVVLAMIAFPTIPGTGIAFKPLTAVMIIILALLDDIPIMTIAYDNTIIEKNPVRWDMKLILTLSTVLGAFAVLQTFGMLFIGMHKFGSQFLGTTIDLTHIQTMAFLQLVVGGHLMLFVVRTKKSMFTRPWPSLPLFAAIIGTQLLAALMCGFGWLVHPLPWALIGVVWAYNLVWMLILDVVKLATLRLLNNQAKHQTNFLDKLTRSLKHVASTLHQ